MLSWQSRGSDDQHQSVLVLSSHLGCSTFVIIGVRQIFDRQGLFRHTANGLSRRFETLATRMYGLGETRLIAVDMDARSYIGVDQVGGRLPDHHAHSDTCLDSESGRTVEPLLRQLRDADE